MKLKEIYTGKLYSITQCEIACLAVFHCDLWQKLRNNNYDCYCYLDHYPNIQLFKQIWELMPSAEF